VQRNTLVWKASLFQLSVNSDRIISYQNAQVNCDICIVIACIIRYYISLPRLLRYPSNKYQIFEWIRNDSKMQTILNACSVWTAAIADLRGRRFHSGWSLVSNTDRYWRLRLSTSHSTYDITSHVASQIRSHKSYGTYGISHWRIRIPRAIDSFANRSRFVWITNS